MQSWSPIVAVPGREPVDFLIAAAAPRELAFAGDAPSGVTMPCARVGKFEGHRAMWLLTGPGPVNAALAAGAALARWNPTIFLNVGVAGAYPGSGLNPGDLAVASREFDADTGVEPLAPGALPAPLSLPVVEDLVHGEFPVDEALSRRLLEAARRVGNAGFGPFATSATVTASAGRARLLASSLGAICETMEGAALARAAHAAGVPFGELRGVSNLVGPRDLTQWRIDDAVAAVGAALRLFLQGGGHV